MDEIEGLLVAMFAERDPSVLGNDYLVLGTVERRAWREGVKQPQGIPKMLEHLHDFKGDRPDRFSKPVRSPKSKRKRRRRRCK